eukprot:GFYU01019148.1.p1 GENE.GFYU01019148.1~~GFYU01019148.1.p1  ORF type:complete len:123 (-),score=15.06 GFYU01019148.1:43-411(-)
MLSPKKQESWMQAAQQPGAILKQGWLYKKGKVVKNWKRRYFVLLSNRQMQYFEKDNTEVPKGTINLNVPNIDVSPSKDKEAQSRGLAFDIVTPARTYVICADDQQSYDEWFHLLQDEIPKAF